MMTERISKHGLPEQAGPGRGNPPPRDSKGIRVMSHLFGKSLLEQLNNRKNGNSVTQNIVTAQVLTVLVHMVVVGMAYN